jgi:hypothetical protein
MNALDDVIFTPKSTSTFVVKDKGTEIMEGLLLEQYKSSPNLKEYIGAFIAEMDFLFESIDLAYYERMLEYASGYSLDVIGKILGQSRTVVLPNEYFGFDGATSPTSLGMADQATPTQSGGGAPAGVFLDESQSGFSTTPLSDSQYRALLFARASVLNKDSVSINDAYSFIFKILGFVPSVIELKIPTDRQVELDISATETSSTQRALILYSKDMFIPTGVTFIVNPV